MKQVLCVETSVPHTPRKGVIKNNIYTILSKLPIGVVVKGIDLWYTLKEFGKDEFFHVSLFVDLPNEEGQVFSKKIEEPQLTTL